MCSLSQKSKFVNAAALCLLVSPLLANANKLNQPVEAEKPVGGSAWEGPDVQHGDGRPKPEPILERISVPPPASEQPIQAVPPSPSNELKDVPNSGEVGTPIDSGTTGGSDSSSGNQSQGPTNPNRPGVNNAAEQLQQSHSNASASQIDNAAAHPDAGRRAHKLDQAHPEANRDQLKNAAGSPETGRRAHKLDQAHPGANRDQLKNAAGNPKAGRKAHKLDKSHPNATRGQVKNAASHPKATRKKK